MIVLAEVLVDKFLQLNVNNIDGLIGNIFSDDHERVSNNSFFAKVQAPSLKDRLSKEKENKRKKRPK